MKRFRKAWTFSRMPALWIWRGCFDWLACWVAIRHATCWIFLGRPATFRFTPRPDAKDAP